MSPLELRSKIVTLLNRDNKRDPCLESVTLVQVPQHGGGPFEINVVAIDPYSTPGATRRYRVTVEEV